MKILGAILAGGRSTRFGSDKAFAVFDGRPLIDHAAAAIRPDVVAIVVCGRGAAPAAMAAIPDWPAPDLGPLGGLCAALRHARDEGYDAVLTIGCDTPRLPPAVLARLLTVAEAAYLRQAPIIGAWPVALAETLSDHLSKGEDRSVRRWAQRVGAVEIDAGCAIPNLNRPADLTSLRHPAATVPPAAPTSGRSDPARPAGPA